MMMAGRQLPLGWGKRKPENDKRYLLTEAVEKMFAEGLEDDDDNDDDDDDDDEVKKGVANTS
jgi:hypothetical protein